LSKSAEAPGKLEGARTPQSPTSSEAGGLPSAERSVMPTSNKAAPPLSIDCIICANKMELISVEPEENRTVYTYRCLNGHLQKLTLAKH
jgi:hypothetical protein